MSSSSSTSQTLTAFALVLASLGAGYGLGVKFGGQVLPDGASGLLGTEVEDDAEGEQEDEQEEEAADGDLAAIKAGFMEPCKIVLVVRTDLKMSEGRMYSQCSHATLSCYKALIKKNPSLVKHWERTGQAKIALRGKSEEQLMELEAIAKSLNLCARSVQDATLTPDGQATPAVLAIGPAPVNLVNEVTGNLRLL